MKILICKKFKKFFFVIFILHFFVLSLFSYNKTFFTKEDVEFIDGDTIKVKGNIIRFIGVDTPEVSESIFNGEQYLGKEASFFTKKQILNAKNLYYVEYKKDMYDRILAYVFVDDKLLPIKIIEHGLGYETVSKYKNEYSGIDKNIFMSWDKEILDASLNVGKPNFENPFYWRLKHKKIKNKIKKQNKKRKQNSL